MNSKLTNQLKKHQKKSIWNAIHKNGKLKNIYKHTIYKYIQKITQIIRHDMIGTWKGLKY